MVNYTKSYLVISPAITSKLVTAQPKRTQECLCMVGMISVQYMRRPATQHPCACQRSKILIWAKFGQMQVPGSPDLKVTNNALSTTSRAVPANLKNECLQQQQQRNSTLCCFVVLFQAQDITSVCLTQHHAHDRE